MTASQRKYQEWRARYTQHLERLREGGAIDVVLDVLRRDVNWQHNAANMRAAQDVFNIPRASGESAKLWRETFMEIVINRLRTGKL
jgi:hypothetical protein